MISVPNIKLMDVLVFVAAVLFGARVGAAVGMLTWLVYGFVNPYGQAGPLIVFLMAGESFNAVAGALFRRSRFSEGFLRTRSLFPCSFPDRVHESGTKLSLAILGVTGLFAAFAYDVFTSTATWILQLYDPSKDLGILLFQSFVAGTLTMNFPLPMGIMHQVSDLLFFASVAPLAIKGATKLGWFSSRVK